jgi:hypothetical protein
MAQRALARAAELVEVLDSRLAYADADRRDLATRLIVAESQANRLTTLYVATYQLHATLDPDAVTATIADIAINLLGAEVFALLLKDGSAEGFVVAISEGTIELGTERAGTRYSGGDPLVDRAVADGAPTFGPATDSPLVAAIPLASQGNVVGILVIRKMLDHHTARLEEDRELIDLLAAHAASALLAARAYAARDRKVRTLESLIRLARGQGPQEDGA